MKRSRMIACCGVSKQSHRTTSVSGSSRDLDGTHRLPHQRKAVVVVAAAAENRGAHNKYAAADKAAHLHGTSPPHRDLGARPKDVDLRDLTVTLPAMVVGGKSGTISASSRTGASSGSGAEMHISNSDKTISKKDKARHKLSNNLLKRAKVLISDRASQSSPYKVTSNPTLCQDKFKVIKIKAAIDKKPTTIDERSTAVLKYRTPHFRAVASVEVPALRENQGVQIGWIQACTEMRFINSYGRHGVTSWEFPEIISGKYTMIGDADGKQYPWYGSKLELQSVQGPTQSPTVTTIHMNDNFFPQVTWYVPHPEFDKTPRLSHIHRKQKFYTFLVAKDLQANQYHVLKTIEWRMELNISVTPSAPLGKRATLCEPYEQLQPVVLDYNSIKLEHYALSPPNANNAQSLIWRPRDGEPRMIVPPVETSIDMERYLQATKSMSFQVCTNGASNATNVVAGVGNNIQNSYGVQLV